MSLTESRQDQRWTAALAVVVALGLLLAVVRVALQLATGQRWDDWALSTVFAGNETRVTLLSALGYVSIGSVIAVAGASVALALVQGRLRLAIAALSIIVGANITTQLLKHSVLSRPDFGFSTLNSLPSGHTTVVASGAAALIMVAPRTMRVVLIALGGFAVTLTGASTVVAGWHRPSDVIAALAVCLLWTGIAAFILDGDRRADRGSAVTSIVAAGAAIAFLVALGVRPMFGWAGSLQGGLVLGVVAAATAAFVWTVSVISPTE